MKFIGLFAIATAVFLAGCAGPETKVLRLGRDIKAASYKRPRNFAPYAADKTHINADTLAEQGIRVRTDKRLQELYDAAYSMTFYFTESMEYLDLQEKVFAEMLRRGDLPVKTVEREYDTRIAARAFDKARELIKCFPDAKLPVLPEIVSDVTLSTSTPWLGYAIGAGGKKITLTTLPVVEGSVILVVMSPGCGFVEQAMNDLLADAEISPLLKEHGLFVSDEFYPVDMAEWGEKYKQDLRNIYISYKYSSFPGVNFSDGTPYFYFLDKGKIMFASVGWCRSGGSAICIAEFKRGLAAISL